MDSLSEINNDMRFEHFIDESLDVDMSACGPIVSTSNVVSYYDEILNTACAPASAVVVRPAGPPQSAQMAQHSPQNRTTTQLSPLQLQQHQQQHSEFLVRLSPVASTAPTPPRRFAPATGSGGGSTAIGDPSRRSPNLMVMTLPRIAVRLFGHEQQPQQQQHFGSSSNTTTNTSKLVETGSRREASGNSCSSNRTISMAAFLTPGVTIKTECIDEQPAEAVATTTTITGALLKARPNPAMEQSTAHAFAIPNGGLRPLMAAVASDRVKLEPGVATKPMPMGAAEAAEAPATAAASAPTVAVAKKPALIEFYCQLCDKSFKSHAEFEKHCRSVHFAAPSYVCQQCPAKQFGNLQSYRTHVKRHVERHPCAICTRTFASAEKLAEHGGTHTSELRLQCGLCQQQFDSFTDYCQHVRIHRRPPAAKPLKWKCPDCGKLFKNRTGITNHAKVHRKNGDALNPPPAAIKTEPTESAAASNAFTTTASGSHNQLTNSAAAARSGSQQLLAATINQVATASPAAASAAAAAASCVPEKPAASLSTGSAAAAAAAVSQPTTVTQLPPSAAAPTTAPATATLLLPPPLPPHTCEVCHKSFPGRTQLLRHRDHHNERSFKCLTCSKFYKTERDLKVHSLVHYEQRPHACTHCGKSFLSSSKLKQHSNVHTGERPFKCKYCDKTFTNFPNWLKHVRRSHKVDHKTGEQLEQLPNFLVREKKGTAAGGAGGARAKKEKAAAAAAAAESATTPAANGEAVPTAAAVAIAKPRASAARKTKAQQQTAKAAQPPQTQLRPPPLSITIKEETKEFVVPADSALDLHDTNAVAPQSALTPLTPNHLAAATATATATATAASVYQDEASLPLDLRDMSASIQLQQSIDVHDMQQMQMLITSHDESFASIEDVPLTQFAAGKKQSPIAGGGGGGQQQQSISFAKLGLRMPQMSPIKPELAATSRAQMLGGFSSSSSISSTPIKAEPGRFSFARSADGSLPVGFAAVTGNGGDFAGANDGTAPAMVPNGLNGATTTTVVASANATKTKQQQQQPQQLSPLAAAASVQRRHFGGVATSHHMFATNVL